GENCGVRAHASLLADELNREGVVCTEHWLARREPSPRAARAEVLAWTRSLRAELECSRPDAVLFHYSVFAYSYRGFPVFVHPTVSALRESAVPTIAFMHELAYPWTLGGLRGGAWAIAHRALLVEVMSVCTAAIVTTDWRAEWLATRRWLPQRPVALAPVFSNLPPPTARPCPARDATVLGMFGYSYDEPAIALVLDALRLLWDRGLQVKLSLLGAPGRESPLAETWLNRARARGLDDALSFAGPLPAQELSDALASCDVLLFADGAGPSSRKGTLAGSLASGRPVVATDGPRTWSELVRAEAAIVVEPTSGALAGAVVELLADERELEALGRRGRAFAEERMGVGWSVGVVKRWMKSTTASS
ncbi:MAG: glycosyltransferase family 4 protein, partial [Solirubrobacteraceae bacterium]